jgi:DNA end-binding protein Ku
MDALKRSLASERQALAAPKAVKGKKPKKRIEGQREMLLPISGKRAAKEEAKAETKAAPAKKPARSSARARKAG